MPILWPNIAATLGKHNKNFTDRNPVGYKDYFGTILKDVGKNIMLDLEQRIAV